MIQITDQEFQQLVHYIKQHYGIHLKAEKRTLVMGRLGSVLQQLRMNSFTEYIEYVQADPTGQASRLLADKISTNHTFFMREPEHFLLFRDQVLPSLVHQARDQDLRVWSAGCSTGEEPYTLAMIMDEYFGLEKSEWDTRVLATDLSSKVLDTCRAGLYEEEKLQALPAPWRKAYFQAAGPGKFKVAKKLQQEVIFRRFNLMEPVFPFKKKFHVIFCRNVMIYFDAVTKRQLVEKFYEWMEPGGYLFIGHSETLDREHTKFKYMMPAVYRKEG
ncbi:protein-glutamate O-methyltransferase CheR [Paenibacillus sp. F411]|uniref:protein-glutamate O-methyltransferase n=1 Tax=Paenibacillus algicola TaxID=2565926 RepID=A0A4P8XHY9_9BACL|nr:MULTISPECIES: protein-glutamate O-methyltransferase CheR [Paenibacillus]MBO2944081.1 protein-glutamate O-methyltransferase CheR [Paenibacillus sp. F411]QCT01813.1 MCP methyltransferase, CheR-type [Paenibacillus algicola]